MSIKKINPPALLKFDALARVVVAENAGSTVYIAGQSAYTNTFELVGAGDYRAQATQALHNLKTAVEAAGGTVDNIVSSTVYIKGLNGQASEQVLTAMATAMDGKPFPAHAFSMIGVEALSGPDLLVEISAIAVLKA